MYAFNPAPCLPCRRAPSLPKQTPYTGQRAGGNVRSAVAHVVQGLAHGGQIEVALAKGQMAKDAPQHVLQAQVDDAVAEGVD